MGLAKASLEANTRFLAASLGKNNIRVNAISAGPIKTLAASGVKNFRKMLSEHSKIAPLGRTITAEEVGNVATFLCSDYTSGITGEITYVDGGFNIASNACRRIRVMIKNTYEKYVLPKLLDTCCSTKPLTTKEKKWFLMQVVLF